MDGKTHCEAYLLVSLVVAREHIHYCETKLEFNVLKGTKLRIYYYCKCKTEYITNLEPS